MAQAVSAAAAGVSLGRSAEAGTCASMTRKAWRRISLIRCQSAAMSGSTAAPSR